RPTNHRVYGEAMAILAGDGLLTEAFRLLAEEVDSDAGTIIRLVSGLTRAAGSRGMVGGQAIDILYQGNDDKVDAALLETLHRRKTGAMITGALLAGIELGGGGEELRHRLKRFGDAIGLAFQVADDILDETGDQNKLGKDVGSDREAGKLTFVSLYGIDQSRKHLAELHRVARQTLEPLGERGEPLKALADYIVTRDR
ncbi:MAG: polyprenyl synthetase family protein, partial [Deltaproteobacteria bacterium]|nr:polyprenyl synthetase family protein [Deltaproteobacteria bacterium]